MLFTGLECNDKKDDPEGECLYFRNMNITWRKAPTVAPYWPLNPEEYLSKIDVTYEFYYRPSDFIEKVCLKETIVVVYSAVIKEEFAGDFLLHYPKLNINGKDYVLSGYGGELDISTSDGYQTQAISFTIPGGAIEGGESTLQLGVILDVFDQGSHASTIEFFNNAVFEVEIDWAYTEY